MRANTSDTDFPHSGSLLPTSAADLPCAASSHGSWIVDDEGREFLDGSSGAITASLGHANEEMIERISSQARKIAFAHRTQFETTVASDLAGRLADTLPGDINCSMFLSSGSDAIETAMRLALRYWQVRGEPAKSVFLSRTISYHGSTLGAASLTGHPERRGFSTSLLHDFPSVRAPQPEGCLRCDTSCNSSCAIEVDEAIDRVGADRVAAFFAEPIGGSSAGILVPGSDYWARVRRICDERDVLWIADEVMTGVGRTGRWWACERWNAVPDLIVSGKGISGGYAALSAVSTTTHVAETILAEDRFIEFGNTFTNAPIAAAAGLAALEIIERDGLVERAEDLGQRVGYALADVVSSSTVVSASRGHGLFWGIEIRNPDTSRPFPRTVDAVSQAVTACRQAGLIVFRSARHLNGVGDVILFAPPLTVTDTELEEMLTRLGSGLSSLSERLGGDAGAKRWSAEI
jgi:adenosylmethionine-8-amino-7-oxononanoate aminotransferase